MYSELPADIRAQHPYHMYDEIKAQPEAVARSLVRAEEVIEPLAGVIRPARRVYLVGCGTSYHAALAGAAMLREFSRGALDVRAVQSYEFVTYLPDLDSADVLLAVSHSGTTAMTLRALRRAREAGMETIAVTGFPSSEAGGLAGTNLPTGYDDERSWAHTVSYTAALASLAALGNHLAHPAERLDLSALPEVMREVLQTEETAHRLAGGFVVAARLREPAPIVLAGGGSNAATAHEGALKLLETSYVPAAGWELEQVLHGPLAAVTADSLFFLIVPDGRSEARAAELVRSLQRLDVAPVVLTGSHGVDRFDEAHRILLPDVPEVISAIPAVVPLQFFSYFLAVGYGYNPDLIHRDDERYRLASAEYE